MNFMEIKKTTFFYVKKKENKINTFLDQFRIFFYFVQKKKTFAQKKIVMNFWEIQGKKIVQKKQKCTKKM